MGLSNRNWDGFIPFSIKKASSFWAESQSHPWNVTTAVFIYCHVKLKPYTDRLFTALLIPHKSFFLVDTLGFVDSGVWSALKTHKQEALWWIDFSPQAEVVVGRKAALWKSCFLGEGGVDIPRERRGEMPCCTLGCASSAPNRLYSMVLLLLSDNFIVIALYDFPASSDRDLQLVKGEKLQVLSK